MDFLNKASSKIIDDTPNDPNAEAALEKGLLGTLGKNIQSLGPNQYERRKSFDQPYHTSFEEYWVSRVNDKAKVGVTLPT